MEDTFLTEHRYFNGKTGYKDGYYIDQTYQFLASAKHNLNQYISSRITVEYSISDKIIRWGGSYKNLMKEFGGQIYKNLQQTPYWFPQIVKKLKAELEKEYGGEFELEINHNPTFFLGKSASIDGSAFNLFKQKHEERKKDMEKTVRWVNMIRKSSYDKEVRNQMNLEKAQEIVQYLYQIKELSPIDVVPDQKTVGDEAENIKETILKYEIGIEKVKEEDYLGNEPLAIMYDILIGFNGYEMRKVKNKFNFDEKITEEFETKREDLKEIPTTVLDNRNELLTIEFETKKEYLNDKGKSVGKRLYLATEMFGKGEIGIEEFQNYLNDFGFYQEGWDVEKRNVTNELINNQRKRKDRHF